MLTRVVSRASVAEAVQHSKVVLRVGRGTVWKWSYSQTESQGPASAALATAVIASYCSTGSAISFRSIFQPCGTNTPKRTLMPANLIQAMMSSDGDQVRSSGRRPHEADDMPRHLLIVDYRPGDVPEPTDEWKPAEIRAH